VQRPDNYGDTFVANTMVAAVGSVAMEVATAKVVQLAEIEVAFEEEALVEGRE
jgi:hypothetical protein